MKNAINWFEIPVKNIDEAIKFYSAILGVEMQVMQASEMAGMKAAFFPADMQNGGIGGCLMEGPGYEPSANGSLVYLNGGDDLAGVLSKVEEAGGKVLLPKTAIGHNGFMAYFADIDGNKVGLHSRG